MNILLILRPEIFSIFIVTFLIIYDRICARYRSDKDSFLKFALACLGHSVFALLTEITVNSELIPQIVNDGCHILFFFFSLLYTLFFLEYALSLIMPAGKIRSRIMKIGYLICAISIIIMLFSPIDYLTGEFTKYSAGIGPTLCYSLGFLNFIIADILMIVFRKRIQNSVLFLILPLSFISMAFLVTQILIPEFLYTAQSLTLVVVGLFFAIENPIGKFRTTAFIDQRIQTWNRNCFDYDLRKEVPEKLKAGSKLTLVMGDVNGLKAVNDGLGHLTGDKLIENMAKIMMTHLKSAFKIYRVGGDEFIALYFDQDPAVVESQINAIVKACEDLTMGEGIPVGLSVGFAHAAPMESIESVSKRAEEMMYENKRKYYATSGLNRRTH